MVTNLQSQSFSMKDMKDDTEALGNTMMIFQQLQDSIDFITESPSGFLKANVKPPE